MQGVQVKLRDPLTMRAIPKHLRDVTCIGAIQINISFTFTFMAFTVKWIVDALQVISVKPVNRVLMPRLFGLRIS